MVVETRSKKATNSPAKVKDEKKRAKAGVVYVSEHKHFKDLVKRIQKTEGREPTEEEEKMIGEWVYAAIMR
jgi:hypothetical protein